MKKKELKQLQSSSRGELEKKVAQEREKLQTLRFDLHMGKVSNVRTVKAAKRAVAQLLTILNNHA